MKGENSMDTVTLTLAKAYTDSQRLAFAETETVEVLSETTINLEMAEDGVAEGVSEKMISLTAGQTYNVVWDGVRYECVAQIFDGSAFIGNLGILGLDDTGEPFMLIPGDNGIVAISMTAGNHTLSITQETETIHPIDPKFLPGVVLPVVELTSVGPHEDGESITLSESDCAKLNAVGRMPFIMTVKLEGGESLSFVMNCLSMNEYGAYYGGYLSVPIFGDVKITLIYDAASGYWIYYQKVTEP